MAERLKSCVRARDTVCRLGGDEFVFLLEDTKDVAEAAVTAQRVLDALKKPFLVGEHELFVVASIGIVLGASSKDRPEDLLRNAGLAMYRAKRCGKARYEVFDRSMNERLEAPAARDRVAPGHQQRRAAGPLPAEGIAKGRWDSGHGGAGSIPSGASSSPTSSSPWRRRRA